MTYLYPGLEVFGHSLLSELSSCHRVPLVWELLLVHTFLGAVEKQFDFDQIFLIQILIELLWQVVVGRWTGYNIAHHLAYCFLVTNYL